MLESHSTSIDQSTLNGPSLNLEVNLEQQRQRIRVTSNSQLIVALNASLYDDGKQRYNPTAQNNDRSSLDQSMLNGPSLNRERNLEVDSEQQQQ
jgi:hypothetical protein